jgi:hypothetical protein
MQVTSQSEQMRSLCSQTMVLFLLDYPLGEARTHLRTNVMYGIMLCGHKLLGSSMTGNIHCHKCFRKDRSGVHTDMQRLRVYC